MRALCGAIITAGALLGLGLTAVGFGNRYAHEPVRMVDGRPDTIRLQEMDRTLIFILVFTTSAAVIGLGITIAGLAYHHARREREYQWERERHAAGQRTAV